MPGFLPIDYQKSIAKKKLVYRAGRDLTFEYVCFYGAAFAIIGACSAAVIIGYYAMPFYCVIIALVAILWFVLNTLLLNAFVSISIEGTDINDNKKKLLKILPHFFDLDNLDESETNVIRDARLHSFLKSSRVITCLFNDNIIYLNITYLMRANALSVFGGLFGYYRCKIIAKAFKQSSF